MRLNTNFKTRVQGQNKGSCPKCATKKDQDYYRKNGMLPIWYQEGVPQYHLPECLKVLRHAEKMIIQRLSAFVPLHHLINGTFGLQGHCCAFEQDVGEFVDRLPRHRKDTSFLKVMQSIKAEIGSDRATHREFKVRKREVIAALVFLKEHSTEYRDIIIDKGALDWIKGEEAYLEGFEVFVEDPEPSEEDKTDKIRDRGPTPEHNMEPEDESDNLAPFGYIDEGYIGEISEEEKEISRRLKETIRDSGNSKNIAVDWPTVDDRPVSEYGDRKIFANAFPWLFPGGIGDVRDHKGDMTEWGKMLLYYEDGRFAKDKIFCFFAMNYITRRRNSR